MNRELKNLISGFGLGITIALFLLPAQNSVVENRRSVAAGLVQLSRNLGGALGAIIGNRFQGSVIIDRENFRIRPFENT